MLSGDGMTAEPFESHKLQSAFEELRLINNLVHAISQVRESNHIMSIIITEMVRASDADQGIISAVSRIDPEAINTLARRSDGSAGSIPFVISDSISGWVLKNKTILKVDDLDADTRFMDVTSEEGRFKSIVCAPMFVGGEIIGLATTIRSHLRGPFTDQQCRLIGTLASQTAYVLANAQLAEDLANKNAMLSASYARLNEENALLKSEISGRNGFERIVGVSKSMKQLLVMASKFSANDAPILITGETGTGKELIARGIHSNSNRRGKSFVVKNCGIKTESLLEAELFGYVKGAFTGADRDKPGLFKEANQGTIFLDEIGDAPASTQAAILRAIQHGEIRPVGSSKTETVDVRVISATNKDLKEEIREGRFREDLYYRLNTLALVIPPLRERPEDISVLIDHFLGIISAKSGRTGLSISNGALQVLATYRWPGNVRQVEHEMERASVLCGPDNVIEPTDLSPEILEAAIEAPGLGLPKGELRSAVEKLERTMIVAALGENNGNLVHTAQALGLTRKGLKDKIARYEIRANSD
jgi:transcriptional regulator with GAF, ATPase, and Fis domain